MSQELPEYEYHDSDEYQSELETQWYGADYQLVRSD